MTSIKNNYKITLAVMTAMLTSVGMAQNAAPMPAPADAVTAAEIDSVAPTTSDLQATLDLANEALARAQEALQIVITANQTHVDQAKAAVDVSTSNSENAKNIAESAANILSAAQDMDKTLDPEGKIVNAAKLNDQTAKSNIDNATKSLNDSQNWYDAAIKPINDAKAVVDTAQKQVDEAKIAIDEANKAPAPAKP